MMKASEARVISGPTAEEYAEDIEKYIRDAAEKKQRMVIIRSEPYAYWLYYKEQPQQVLDALKILKDSGYKVSLFYEERQFVDMGLQIEW